MDNIAFLRVFATHPFLASLENLLNTAFPEYQVHTITLTHLLKARPDLLALNAAHVFKEYFRDMRRDPHVFHTRFLRTPFLFRQARKLVQDRLQRSPEAYRFSFQWQSLFDLSLPGLPHFVYTDHTYQESRRYAFGAAPYSAAWAKLEPEIYSSAEVVFTWSSNITRSLERDYGLPQRKVVQAFTGSNLSLKARPDEPHDYSGKRILFVGSDWERKGGPELAEAFRLALQAHPDAELTIVGPAPALTLPNCHAVGRVPLEQLGNYYHRATIFCLPTRRDPFGNAFIDALQHRLPIVAARVGAVPDVIIDGENGWLVQPGDIPALAQALIRLLDDVDLRRSFGERSFTLWKECYNWENVGRIMREAILQRLSPAEDQETVRISRIGRRPNPRRQEDRQMVEIETETVA